MDSAAFACKVDLDNFERTLRRYSEVSGKALDACLWRKLTDWSYAALKVVTARNKQTRARLPQFPAAGKGAKSPQWKLVRWLAVRQVQQGLAEATGGKLTSRAEMDSRRGEYINRTRLWVRGADGRIRRSSFFGAGLAVRLGEVADKEAKKRRASVGFTGALILTAAKASKAKGASVTGGGRRGLVDKATGATKRSAISGRIKGRGEERDARSRTAGYKKTVSATAVYQFALGVTRAFQARTTAGIDRLAGEAYRSTLGAVVADMETYIARKLDEAAVRAAREASR